MFLLKPLKRDNAHEAVARGRDEAIEQVVREAHEVALTLAVLLREIKTYRGVVDGKLG